MEPMSIDSYLNGISLPVYTYAILAASVQEGVQLVSTLELCLLGGESSRLGSSDKGDLVALGRAALSSVAAENGALEGGLVVHPPEGRLAGQVRRHVAHIVQVTNVSLHQGTADHQKAN